MLKVVVLPATGVNCAKLQILLDDVVFVTIDAHHESLVNELSLKISMCNGDMHIHECSTKF